MKKLLLYSCLSMLFLTPLVSEDAPVAVPAVKTLEKAKAQKKIVIKIPQIFEAKSLLGYSPAATSAFVTALEETGEFDIIEYPAKTDLVEALKEGDEIKLPEIIKKNGRARFIIKGKLVKKKTSSKTTISATIIDFNKGRILATVSVKAETKDEIIDKMKFLAEDVKSKLSDAVSGKLEADEKAKREVEKAKKAKEDEETGD